MTIDDKNETYLKPVKPKLVQVGYQPVWIECPHCITKFKRDKKEVEGREFKCPYCDSTLSLEGEAQK
jgi:hypothetical protein